MIATAIKKHFPGDFYRTVAIREHLLSVCTDFVEQGLADPKFTKELGTGSDQKFWSCISEALIAEKLQGKTFGSRKVQGAGPDFLLMDGDRKIWIEVICPEPTGIPSNWLNPPNFSAYGFPHEKILLRWTSAIKTKAEALIGSADGRRKGYLNSGMVSKDDAYVIAINGCRLHGPFPSIMGISQYPFAMEAVFAIGPIQLRVNTETLDVVDQSLQHRPFVLNKNKAQVPAYTFLDPRFNPISAIWAVDLNGGGIIGNFEPMAVIHNPNALNPLSIGYLPTEDEYIAVRKGEEFELSNVAKPNDNS